ncbi:MAG: ribosome small subunit-dependent GTPase A [Chloroflexota bacterium]
MNTDHEYDQGVVFRKSTGHYTVHSGGREFVCVLSSRLRKKLIYPIADPTSLAHIVREVRPIEGIDPVAIGDRVTFFETEKGAGMITEILPRQSKLSRPAAMPGRRHLEQVIVANADQAVPVLSAASPPPKWPLLDRYLVSAESSALPSLIVITKLDLAGPENGLEEAIAVYRGVGYQVRGVSVVTGEGLDELKEALRGRVSVFIGKSGVGKTSLLNALQPGLGLRVRAVGTGKQGKGRHATTHLEMFPLDFGGAVVDTPGMREFGLWDVRGDDLALYFPEMHPLVGGCKFGLDCRHDSEPGCAIRKAVMDGLVSPLRYQSLLHLQEEQ